MDKELCLKFLVHLRNCASNVLRKRHMYDPAGALQAIRGIPEETAGDKVMFVSKFLLKGEFKWPPRLFGTKDDAHAQREAKVTVFRETAKKVPALVEFSAGKP